MGSIDQKLGVDLRAVAEWMDEQGLPSGPITHARRLSGGTQNILVRFSRGSDDYVLRRGPKHLREKSNDAILREMKILAALRGSDVPHPQFIAGCSDIEVLGDAVFYLMEPVEGFNPAADAPSAVLGAEFMHEMGLNAVRALARLGALDYQAAGLGDLGRADGFLERQVPRWRRQLEGYRELDGYSGEPLPMVDETASWLADNVPTRWTPGILHGDFHLANLIYRWDQPEVAAIVDWEMCTIGDPLLDLGWLLTTREIGLTGTIKLPSDEILVATYAALSLRSVDHIEWYRVMAGFKLGVILEGTHARAQAGMASKELGDVLHVTAAALFSHAHDRVVG
jgi:aminoglycoside phosphotransferase (APT) family kinase protein